MSIGRFNKTEFSSGSIVLLDDGKRRPTRMTIFIKQILNKSSGRIILHSIRVSKIMLKYEGSIWRPPSESRSLILQASIGCSKSTACTFCVSYRKKEFKVKSQAEFTQHVKDALKTGYGNSKRIFLADGNALAIPIQELEKMCEILKNNFPHLERIGIYGSISDILKKSSHDLFRLKQSGIGIIYTGLESGDNYTLKKVRKGITKNQNISGCQKVIEANIPLSVMVILGLAGQKRSHEHAIETAHMLSSINPDYLAALTLMLPEGTEIHNDMINGRFIPLNQIEILQELFTLLSNISNQENTVFRTNHASNYLSLRGILMQDKEKLVNIIKKALEKPGEYLRSEIYRGL